jgi:hypothetical protein
MKNKIPILLILIVFLASCSYPASNSTPDTGLVDTQVAVLLTEMLTNTATPDLKPTEVIPTPTSTVEPTLTSTSTSTETPTAIPTATFTPQPNDPALTMGDPTWINPSDWSGFYLNPTDPNIQITESGGNLVFTALNPNGWHGWSMTYHKVQDFYLEGTYSVGTCSGGDRYGLVFRAPNTSEGYFFGVTCDGEYSLKTMTTDGFTESEVISWTQSSDILTGSNQTNRLGVMAQGDHYSLYINGVLVSDGNDDLFLNSGIFGSFIASTSTINFTVNLKKLAYWDLS